MDDVIRLVLANVRTPEERRGDLAAQRAACGAGRDGWLALRAREGGDQLDRACDALLEYTARRARARVAKLGDIHGVARDALELHFRDLDDAVEILGRRERLRRAAADFEGGISRGEAIGFAALVALADGRLADPEAGALHEIGRHLGLSETEVDAAVGRVVSDLRQQLSA